jgi:endonuclease I
MATKVTLSAIGSIIGAVFALGLNTPSYAEPLESVQWNNMLASCNSKSGDAQSFCVRNELAHFTNASLRSITYGGARNALLQKIDRYIDQDGVECVDSVYSIDVHCRGTQPHDEKTFNVEHTWPQSKLKKYSRFAQTKADLFHLFPTETRINSMRGNLPFSDCNDNSSKQNTRVSAFCNGGFQPPAIHRGMVARAMFYMAVNYGMEIDATQEAVLRKWNKEFPVTNRERERDNLVNEYQGNHNPFIAHPEWTDLINNF